MKEKVTILLFLEGNEKIWKCFGKRTHKRNENNDSTGIAGIALVWGNDNSFGGRGENNKC